MDESAELNDAERELVAAQLKYDRIREKWRSFREWIAKYGSLELGFFTALPIELTTVIVLMCDYSICVVCSKFANIVQDHYDAVLHANAAMPSRFKQWVDTSEFPAYMWCKIWAKTYTLGWQRLYQGKVIYGIHVGHDYIAYIVRKSMLDKFVYILTVRTCVGRPNTHSYYRVRESYTDYSRIDSFVSSNEVLSISNSIHECGTIQHNNTRIAGRFWTDGAFYGSLYSIHEKGIIGVGVTRYDNMDHDNKITCKLRLNEFNSLAAKYLIKRYVKGDMKHITLEGFDINDPHTMDSWPGYDAAIHVLPSMRAWHRDSMSAV